MALQQLKFVVYRTCTNSPTDSANSVKFKATTATRNVHLFDKIRLKLLSLGVTKASLQRYALMRLNSQLIFPFPTILIVFINVCGKSEEKKRCKWKIECEQTSDVN